MISSQAVSSEERRVSPRHLACLPAYIEKAQGQSRSALICGMSVTGALLFTRSRLAPGDAVKVNLYLSNEPERFRAVRARVVRFEQRSIERSDVWAYNAAIEFEEPLNDIEPDIKSLALLQAKNGLFGKTG